MLRRFLTPQAEALLAEERRALVLLREPLGNLDATDGDLATLDRALLQLDELFLLVVVGEFNAGKSAFINALLGDQFLAEGVTPTTSAIHLLRHGNEPRQAPIEHDVIVATYPVEWLRDINIVDTPGTNAVIRRHQEIAEDFIPRADLVLFVTSADRPFTESEREFIERIREWGKKIVFVVNKTDILESDGDVERIVEFVAGNARQLIGGEPTVFAVSSRQARQAKQSTGDERARLWAASRFEALEGYILRTLDERERLRLKLASPLGIAQRLVARYRGIAEARRELLREDAATARTIDSQLAMYEADMRREFGYHLSHIDNVLYAMAERGSRFFDETIRLQRIFDLVNADRVRGMFEREVVADTSAQVEAETRDLIDWLVDQDYRQWQAVMDYVNKQIQRHEDRIIGRVGGAFEGNRQELLRSVGSTAREVVAGYDHSREARALGDSVQRAVAQTALVEVGAIGLGALLVTVLATSVADVTGVLAAGALAAAGLYVLPNKRRRAQRELQAKIGELRRRLADALTGQFEAELAASLARIREAMRPYTRFVDAQQATIGETEHSLAAAQARLSELMQDVERTLGHSSSA